MNEKATVKIVVSIATGKYTGEGSHTIEIPESEIPYVLDDEGWLDRLNNKFHQAFIKARVDYFIYQKGKLE